jgi:hypothetical protein
MYNALSYAKWNSHVVDPVGPYWIRDAWLPLVQELIGG